MLKKQIALLNWQSRLGSAGGGAGQLAVEDGDGQQNHAGPGHDQGDRGDAGVADVVAEDDPGDGRGSDRAEIAERAHQAGGGTEDFRWGLAVEGELVAAGRPRGDA